MGLEIILQDERGHVLESLEDPKNVLHRVLQPYQGRDSVLAEIDWYGDTVFNRIQIPRFLTAWHEMAKTSANPEEAKLIDQISALAERCEDGVHLYLKFIGD